MEAPVLPPPSGDAVIQEPHPTILGAAVTSASAPSKLRPSSKISAAQVPSAPMPASTPIAAVDGSMEGGQQVLDELPARMAATPFWIPQMSMTFCSFDEAWHFWLHELLILKIATCSCFKKKKDTKENGAKKNNAKKNSAKKKKTSKPVQHEESGCLAPDPSQPYERKRESSVTQVLFNSSVIQDVSNIHSLGRMDGSSLKAR
ncbi:unnamed protein product [Urochloa decumbens]|uniref:Uncharacterized protein n=1 Tax=Urochloa decumbens TaxID=240449 RepID=A0ABC9F1W3_9POAL